MIKFSQEKVLLLHKLITEETGGDPNVRDIALLNSALALLLYKPIINAMRGARLVPRSEHKTEFNRSTVFTLIIGGVSLLTALLVLLIIW